MKIQKLNSSTGSFSKVFIFVAWKKTFINLPLASFIIRYVKAHLLKQSGVLSLYIVKPVAVLTSVKQ